MTYQKVNSKINQDEKYRLTDYKQTLLIFWSLTLLILINYFVYKQPTLNFYPKFSLVSIGLTILVMAFAFFQYTTTKVSANSANMVKEKLKDVYHYLPKTNKELNWFLFLSISAGICEEMMFRLFLFEFLKENTNLITAFVLTNIIFAITHIGSGKNNLISSFILGLLFSAIYYITDNIWIAIILHSSIDINTGILGYRINRTTTNENSSSPNH
ncbi:membrane protease YdiL (CAAX protease family) [Algoriphagus sp. 4150]|uniref:CPBP family intramembrane glutamic endopeptidase n=1 Tax=Algoriphagus sp. 4150 TaxID=2817756 RepID=UPI002854E0DC|nr:CPBP family intramembrane glutamic endopeptidase [Algoriphagus sp. 4150]MDR7130972.1 membrane protease YdiL (CAAX protease family) [Algoriphagus sp. 4150]